MTNNFLYKINEDKSDSLQDLLKNEVNHKVDNLASKTVNPDHKLDKPAYFTIYRGFSNIGKTISLNEQGELSKIAGSQWVNEGCTFSVDSIVALAQCHEYFSNSREYALGYGIARDSGLAKIYRIGLKNKSKDGEKTRTNADFELPANMVIMVDLDAYGDLTPDEQLAKFFEINPELVKIDHIVRPSCSSYIYNPEKEGDEPKVKGYHLYFFCKSSELQQIIDLLWNRCVLAGFVRTILSKSGALLVRSLFDISIYQPCRMDFIGPVVCKPPLKQLPLESKVVLGDKAMLLLKDLNQLSEKEIADGKNIISQMKAKLKPQSVQRKKDFREERVSQLPAKERKAARDQLKQAQEKCILDSAFVLLVHTDEGIKEVTVADILKNPEIYNKLRCCDPIDPSYDDYTPCAILNLDADNMNVYDFHSDTIYSLGEFKPTLPVTTDLNEAERVIFDKFIIPDGYFVSNSSIYKYTDKKNGLYKTVTNTLIVVSNRIHKQDGTIAVTLAYDDNGIIRHVDVPRKDIASRDIIQLADYGVDVNSTNYTALTLFLSEIERANLGKAIKDVVGIQTLGFAKVNNTQIFLTGTEYISSDGAHPMSNEDDSAAPIKIIYPDYGTRLILESIKRNGSREAWIEAVKRLNPFPYAKIAIAAAGCSPLLELLSVDNFTIHLGCPTSTGKTTCLKVAASAVGNFDSLKEDWNSTLAAIETKAYFLNPLPLFIDDSKTIGNKDANKFLCNVVYMLASGTSKARATKNCGRQAIRRWNSVCISTGEANILSQIAAGGANVRIIDLPDLPFKEKDKDIGYLIDNVVSVTKVNYGHAVVEVVEDILKKGSNSLVEYKTRYAELQKELNKRLPPGEGGRLGKSVAFIILSIEVLNKVMGLGWSTDDVKATLVDCAIKQSVEDTEGNKALSYIYNYACANQGDRYCDNEGGTLIEMHLKLKNQHTKFLMSSKRDNQILAYLVKTI